MYIFGGNNTRNQQQMEKGEPNTDCVCDKMYYLNLKTMSWSLLRTRGEVVLYRDEHTAVYDDQSTQMLVFGGFEQGNRVNSIAIYNFSSNSWRNLELPDHVPQPSARSGHSAVIVNGNMYIFGGKNDDSEKLNDLWKFSLTDELWTELQPTGEIPFERSGHSMTVIGDIIVIFGGIWDVTKELNDLHAYSITNNKWTTLNDSANQAQIERSPNKIGKDQSPLLGNSAAMRVADTPGSPNRDMDFSPARLGRSTTKKLKDSSMVKTKQSAKKRSTGG